MFDNLRTKIGNFINLIGDIGMWVAIGIFALLLVYVLLYSKFDIFTHSHYKFVQNFKKWIKIIIVCTIVAFILQLLSTWITPSPVQSWEDF